METKELVIKALKESDKALKSAEIAASAGIDKAEVDKVLKTLKKEDRITSPKNCYYALK
jgi:DNA-binding IscR family transcriptional regulator